VHLGSDGLDQVHGVLLQRTVRPRAQLRLEKDRRVATLKFIYLFSNSFVTYIYIYLFIYINVYIYMYMCIYHIFYRYRWIDR
jgi:hypothetical protein